MSPILTGYHKIDNALSDVGVYVPRTTGTNARLIETKIDVGGVKDKSHAAPIGCGRGAPCFKTPRERELEQVKNVTRSQIKVNRSPIDR